MTELFKNSAVQVVDLLKSGEISPLDLIEEAIARIEKVDERINALPIRCFERARHQAKKTKLSFSSQQNYLYGLPIAVKDYNDVGGVRTTYGSPIYADNVPEKSDATVGVNEVLGAAGLQTITYCIHQLGQQVKVVLKKRIAVHLPVIGHHA